MSGKMSFVFDDIVVGEKLGPLTYQITADKLAAFRAATADPAALMITIAAKEYAYLLWARYEEVISINAKHEAWYGKPPTIGDTLTAHGRIAERYVRRGRRYLVIETRTEDQHGAHICRNRVTLLMGGVDGP
jgi:acyl dehydratase